MTEQKKIIKRKALQMAAMILMLVFTFSSCKKEEDFIPSSMISVAPANNVIVDPAATLNLKWSGVTAIKFNVYFGEKTVPELYKAGITAQSLDVPVVEGRTYYWQVGFTDASGKETLSQVYTFKVKTTVNLDNFTGIFDCDEPKYARYDVSISKVSKDTLEIDNFWDMKWKLKYVFDDMGKARIVPSTFTPDPSLKVSVTGSGTFDNEKKQFTVAYVVLQDASAGSPLAIEIDRNTHTFIKK